MPWLNKWAIHMALSVGLVLALAVQTTRLSVAQKKQIVSAQVAAQWRSNFEAIETTNAANVRAFDELQKQAIRNEDAAEHARSVNAKLNKNIEIIRTEIRHALPEDNGLVRRVLCDAVNGLRQIAGETNSACSN